MLIVYSFSGYKNFFNSMHCDLAFARSRLKLFYRTSKTTFILKLFHKFYMNKKFDDYAAQTKYPVANPTD